MNFKQFCSFDNFYSIGFLLLLTLKLTIRIIGRGDMVKTKLERGEGWKNNNVVTM